MSYGRYNNRYNDRYQGDNVTGNIYDPENRRGRGYYGNRRGYGRPKKHSGAKYHSSTKNGNPAISAWNYSRKHGLLSVLIAPYKGSRTVMSKTGKEWYVWMCSIQGKGVQTNFPVLVEAATKRAFIRNGYGWVVNPNARNGGYCGQFGNR